MSNRFSFSTADQVISLLTAANQHLREQNRQLSVLSRQIEAVFRDSGYQPLDAAMAGSLLSCEEISKQIDLIAAALGHYREELYRLYTEDLIERAGLNDPGCDASGPRFGSNAGALERQNRRLAFRDEVKRRLRAAGIPAAAREIYASVGSKCAVASSEHTGTAHYDPGKQCIRFNLEADLNSPCGALSTYFHEVGHMIDFQTRSGGAISDDAAFGDALKADCRNYIAAVRQRDNCSKATACLHIRRELMQRDKINLYADASDIMGALTGGVCQGVWGHSQSYWRRDPNNFRQEAFASFFSASMGTEGRAEAVQHFFPTAYQRFLQLLKEADL